MYSSCPFFSVSRGRDNKSYVLIVVRLCLACFQVAGRTTVLGDLIGWILMLINLVGGVVIILRPELQAARAAAAPPGGGRLTRAGFPSVDASWAGSVVVDVVCDAALVVEVVCNLVAYGAVRGKGAWLRQSPLNALDLAIVAVSALELATWAVGGAVWAGFWVRSVRLVRLLGPISRLSFCGSMRGMIRALGRAAGDLLSLTVLLLLASVSLGLFGMAALQGSFRRRCVTLPHAIPACASRLLPGLPGLGGGVSWDREGNCSFGAAAAAEQVQAGGGLVVVSGGFPFETMCKVYTNTTPGQFDGVYSLDPTTGEYHTCGVRARGEWDSTAQRCADVGNPNGGFQQLDDIGGALLVALQIAVTDRTYLPLRRALQAEPDTAWLIWIYFVAIGSLCTLLLLGIFQSVVAAAATAEAVSAAVAPAPQQARDNPDIEPGQLAAMVQEQFGLPSMSAVGLNGMPANYGPQSNISFREVDGWSMLQLMSGQVR